MNSDVYSRLRERLDEYSIGFKSTGTGVEIRLLKALFTEEEAEMYLNLTRSLQTAADIAGSTGQSVERTEEILQNMTEKGLTIPRFPKNDEPFYYSAAPYLHGLLEHQIKRIDKDTAGLMLELNRVGYFSRGPAPLRTIPIHTVVDSDAQVAPYEDVTKVIDRKRRFCVADCACSVVRQAAEHPCERPREVCFLFDFYADYYIERGLGREVDKRELLEILKECDKSGLVPQFGNSVNPDALCNCCPDCCESLLAIKRTPKPAKYANSNYYSTVAAEDCIGCETCIGRCPMGAVTLSDQGVAHIHPDRCIGCGLCVSTCSEGAIQLVRKSEEKIRVPPDKHDFMRSSAEYEADLRRRSKGTL
ncbi:MAG: 4Fe-4S binding protein [Deltaproteobacteria bacterium]|nr:4Fe-4S binding protein [Deltaproteobacteria bacterium]